MKPWQKYPKRFRLITLLSGYLIGLAVGSWFEWGTSDYLLFLALMCFGLFFFVRPYWGGLFFVCLGCILLGYVIAATRTHTIAIKHPMNYEGRVQVVSLRFVKTPQQRATLKLLDGNKRSYFVQTYVYDWQYNPGTILRVKMEIKPSKYKSDRGRNVIGQATEILNPKELAPPSGIYIFRQRLQERVGASLPEPYASLAIGLITGVTDDFDANFREDLQRTGTSHLVAVSGYNLTIIALILQRLGQRKSRLFGFGLAIGSICLYVLLAGGNPSILRGAVIAFLSLFATLAGRITHRLVLLLLCATILSIITPLGMLYSLSWQLSFLAFTGILFINPLLSPVLTAKGKAFGAALSETLSAQILVLPLILYQFGLLSVVSPFVNMVVLTITPLAMGLSIVHSVLALLWLELGRWFAWVSYPILWLIVKPIQWASELPFAAYPVNNFSFAYFVVSYGFIAFLFFVLMRREQRRRHESR
jgi:ComEC/Rec2-related protein